MHVIPYYTKSKTTEIGIKVHLLFIQLEYHIIKVHIPCPQSEQGL